MYKKRTGTIKLWDVSLLPHAIRFLNDSGKSSPAGLLRTSLHGGSQHAVSQKVTDRIEKRPF
ncbi:hypothetical protein HMPREF9303_0847 [Prevotella denticola CRIS 18C-A]|uniref:Uncharacterized protein n=1 Tax=Prevotella denticola CRIS 18C-A TaxID=944557 RepID=F0HAY9_9BACT|nr:hypothetical protein HMPREF9137_2042 [Prevotella denticola F0289]EGC85039.1 hypothetical protein HMPREF9303_0847 [Prevotella denticola CRIS 18C-A]